MDRVVLVCTMASLLVLGSLLLLKPNGTKIMYVPPAEQNLPVSPQAIHFDPPTTDQIKRDLSGKVINVESKDHMFMGPELNYMSILTIQNANIGSIFMDVQICADATVVQRQGLKKTYFHEKVCGSLRIYYDRKDNKWIYRMAENIDMQKILTPNRR